MQPKESATQGPQQQDRDGIQLEFRNVQTFIKKLYRIVCDPSTNHIVSWTHNSTGQQTFTIHDTSVFSAEVLPRHFKHGNLQSFQRQLNKYQFLKLNKGEIDRLVFLNPFFKDSKIEDLSNIQRRGSTIADKLLDEQVVGSKRANNDPICSEESLKIQKVDQNSIDQNSFDTFQQEQSDLRATTSQNKTDDLQIAMENDESKLLRQTIKLLLDIVQSQQKQLITKQSENEQLKQLKELFINNSMMKGSDTIDFHQTTQDQTGVGLNQVSEQSTFAAEAQGLKSIMQQQQGPASIDIGQMLETGGGTASAKKDYIRPSVPNAHDIISQNQKKSLRKLKDQFKVSGMLKNSDPSDSNETERVVRLKQSSDNLLAKIENGDTDN